MLLYTHKHSIRSLKVVKVGSVCFSHRWHR